MNQPDNESLQRKVYWTFDFIRSLPRPILVYQMAKVGSTSVCRSLREAGYNPLHIHSLTRDGKYHNGQVEPPKHYYTENLLRLYLKCTNHRLKVIFLVRDPIARRVSARFQWPICREYVFDSVEETRRGLVEHFSRPGGLEYEFRWFDREVKEMLSVDVMEEKFNRTDGY